MRQTLAELGFRIPSMASCQSWLYDVRMCDDESSMMSQSGYCPRCGYNLRGLSELRCPECGTTFDPDAHSATIIPWTRRHGGRMRAFVRTLWLVTIHPSRLANVAGDIRRDDAVEFRLICAILFAIPLCAMMLLGSWKDALTPVYRWLFGRMSQNQGAWDWQIVSVWNTAMIWPPFLMLIGLAAAHFVAKLPARLSTFPRFPETNRENVITLANYLAGTILAGALSGMLLGLYLAGIWMVITATKGAKPAPLVKVIAIPAGVGATLCVVVAMIRFFWRTWVISQTAVWYLAVLAPVLLALWTLVWLVILPLCVGMLLTILRMP